MSLQDLKRKITEAAAKIVGADVDEARFDVGRTSDSKFGDFATNVAMIYAKELKRSPREVAEEVAVILRDKLDEAMEVVVAGPGFINITLTDHALGSLATGAPDFKPDTYAGKQIVAEYSDPSSFKVLHAGHLYTSVVGDAIANLLEVAGGDVHRVNFGGDVGRHVAMTMWAILHKLDGQHPEKLSEVPSESRADWMSARYVEGNTAYENDETAIAEITVLNKSIYALVNENDRESPLAQIYWECRKWSYNYFDHFYARIGSHFEKYYPESETMGLGLKTVRDQLRAGVYEESDGAVVFRGEKYGLHTRVFINSQGLPTYEAKDVGLIMKKWDDYHYDKSIILTDSSQEEYLSVVLKSIEQFAPRLSQPTTHISHGRVKLAGGVKMSSRKGNIIRAVDVLDLAAEANKEASGQDDEQVVLGAVKYAFLKQRIGPDIVYVPDESVSLEGNSGPYLQYAHARARSILRKSSDTPKLQWDELQSGERVLASKIGEYPEILQKAIDELMPHNICTYLYDAAQVFNRFYEGNRVIGDAREGIRLKLVELYADVLKSGLTVLGITAPDQL